MKIMIITHMDHEKDPKQSSMVQTYFDVSDEEIEDTLDSLQWDTENTGANRDHIHIQVYEVQKPLVDKKFVFKQNIAYREYIKGLK